MFGYLKITKKNSFLFIILDLYLKVQINVLVILIIKSVKQKCFDVFYCTDTAFGETCSN